VQELFDEFRSHFLNITDDSYSYKKLTSAHFDFDAVIVGSDQVWAADFVFTSPAYLLAFVDKGAKKIAYAPSFGKRQLEGYLKSSFKRYSKSIEYLSVRESSGVDLVKELTGRSVTKVLDPTLLLNSYEEIISDKAVPFEKYMVCYRLDQEKNLADWFIGCVERLSVNLGLKVIYVSPNTDPSNSPWEPQMPSPGELLGLINSASLVITNSFHGTVFSLLLKTNFLTLARDSYKDKQNLRMLELLSSVDLSARFIDAFEHDNGVNGSLQETINWDEVDALLEPNRRSSTDFLLKALAS